MNAFKNMDRLKKNFNFGAFLLGWIWGLFNKSYITLIQIPIILFLLCVPFWGIFLNLCISVWFGINGNQWALENKK